MTDAVYKHVMDFILRHRTFSLVTETPHCRQPPTVQNVYVRHATLLQNLGKLQPGVQEGVLPFWDVEHVEAEG